MKLPLMICSPAIWIDRPNSPNNSDSPTMFGFLTLAHEHTCPNGPEISTQRFHQFSCSWWCSFWWKHWYLPHVYIMVMSFGTSFPFGFMKNHCFTAVGLKQCMLNTLKKRYVFGMVSTCIFLSPTAVNQWFFINPNGNEVPKDITMI